MNSYSSLFRRPNLSEADTAPRPLPIHPQTREYHTCEYTIAKVGATL